MTPLLQVRDLTVQFGDRAAAPASLLPALAIADWQLEAGDMVGIRGPSGAGKSTLLNVLSGLLLPQQGRISWLGTEITQLKEGERDRWRRSHIGFIFQDFHLIPELSALENVLQPARFDHWRCPPELRRRARELLTQCGIPRASQLANSLSRGQKQRVAVARALLKNPPILLADEPTASLDRASADAVIELLLEVAQRSAQNLLVVSHDEILLKQLSLVYELREGAHPVMNPFVLILAILRRHRLITLLFVAIVALSVALGVGVLSQEKALRQGSTTAADKFDIIVGAPGSHADLLLSSVYLQPKQVELIDGKLLTEMAANPDVEFAAPLAFGDNYAGQPIVGSTPEFVTYLSDDKLEGRVFERMAEAVAGARASLQIGDRFEPSHGLGEITEEAAEAAEHNALEIEVVGRMPVTGTPWDSAIISSVESVWAIHNLPTGHDPSGPRAEAVGAPFDADFLPGIPAAIVKPVSFGAAYSLRSDYRTAATTAFFPADVLLQLYGLMGDVRVIMSFLTLATQVLVLLGILAGILALMQLFRQQFFVLRAMGAPRLYLLAVMWGYSAVLVLVGSVLGLGLGWVISAGLAGWVSEKTGIAIAAQLGLAELTSATKVVLAGWLLALVPAGILYQQPILEQHQR